MRDLVAMLRVGSRPPRVLGLVVEVLSRRRIFLPDDPGHRASSPARSSPPACSTCAASSSAPPSASSLGELLDRTVRLVETGEQVTVLDVAMQQLPARRDWEIDQGLRAQGQGRRAAAPRARR